MTDVEFKSDQEVVTETFSSDDNEALNVGGITKVFMKLSFGAIKTKEQANFVMVIFAIASFGLSIYFFLS